MNRALAFSAALLALPARAAAFSREDARRFSLPLNNPPVVDAGRAGHMRGDDVVLGLIVAGRARAYPWWILRGYHVVNDEVGGRRVVVAFCEACSAACAFLPRAGGELLTFHACRLRDGSFDMCDYETGGFWSPFAGRALSGPRAGLVLERLPAVLATWAQWSKEHPDGQVLLGSPEQRERPHGRGTSVGSPGLPPELRRTLGPADARLPPNELVFGAIGEDEALVRAYPLARLRDAGGVVSDRLGRLPLLLILREPYAVRAFLRRLDSSELELRVVGDRPLRLRDQNATTWDERGLAVDGPAKGRALAIADGYLAEWYEWSARHPRSSLFAPAPSPR